MTFGRQTFVVALLLLAATVLQGHLAHAVIIKGAQPDFPLVVLACGSLLIGGREAVWLGLWTGLLQASMLSMYIGSHLTSRTLAGAFAGGLQRSLILDSIIVPTLVVLTTTLLAEVVFAAMVPSVWVHHVKQWMHGVLGEMIYNTVLAQPVYLMLRKLHIGERREDPFGRRR